MSDIAKQSEAVIKELIEKAGLTSGQLLVIGCSSSEIVGKTIGHGSSFETAKEVFGTIIRFLSRTVSSLPHSAVST